MDVNATSARSPGVDFLRTTLFQIPTIFGRLVYLSSLRNGPDGVYEHEQLIRACGAVAADHAVRHKHREIFSEWLEQSLQEQKADLTEYLAGMSAALGSGADLEQVVAYRDLIPPAAREVERQLYLTDLEMLSELLRLHSATDSWNPAA